MLEIGRSWTVFFFFLWQPFAVIDQNKIQHLHCTERQDKNNSVIWNIQLTRLDIPALWKSEADSFQYKSIIWTSWSSTRGAKENG